MNRSTKILLVYFLVTAGIFALLVPPFEAPDEPDHLDYINYIITRKSLPNQLISEQCVKGEGHQYPLYYLLSSTIASVITKSKPVRVAAEPNPQSTRHGGSDNLVPLYKLTGREFPTFRDKIAFYSIRLLSILFGLCNIALIASAGKLVFKKGRCALLPAVFAALLPQFLFITGTINNDNLANLLGTAFILSCLKIIYSPNDSRNYLLAGITAGLALITKKNFIALAPGLLVAIGYAFTDTKDKRRLLINCTMLIGTALILSGWWFIRSWNIYGELLGSAMEKNTLAASIHSKSIFSPYFMAEMPFVAFISFVGRFGWVNVPVSKYVLLLYASIISLGLFGFAVRLVKSRLKDRAMVSSMIFVCLCLSGFIYYNLTYTQPQGRFMFPSLSAISLILTYGWYELSQKFKPQVRHLVFVLIITAFIACDIHSIARIAAFYR